MRGTLCLAAADARARRLGLAPGLALADARARVPELTVLDHDAAADRAVLERLAEACDRYTPLVAPDPPDGLLLDITGCSHLFGGEAAMLAEVTTWLGDLGFAARAVIAGAAGTARAIARHGTPGIVPAGEEAEAARPLPVAALDAPPDTASGLARAGLKTVGDLADRPRAPLVARFGEALMTGLDAVLGRARAPISPRRPVPTLMAERRLAEPVVTADAVRACLAQLAAELADRLEARGEGGRRFEASFFRADGQVRRLAVGTARPLRDTETLFRLIVIRLEALADPLDAGCGFDVIRLGVLAAEPLGMRQPGLDGGEEAGREVPALIEQLSARLGADHVRSFRPLDSHHPDRAAHVCPAIAAPEQAPAWRRPEPGEPPLRPLFLFDVPQPVETLAEMPDGPPLRFRWRHMVHEVALAEGPERIAPEWWREEGDARPRDYYCVEDVAGHRFWLFREGLYGEGSAPPRWFLHGLFP